MNELFGQFERFLIEPLTGNRKSVNLSDFYAFGRGKWLIGRVKTLDWYSSFLALVEEMAQNPDTTR